MPHVRRDQTTQQLRDDLTGKKKGPIVATAKSRKPGVFVDALGKTAKDYPPHKGTQAVLQFNKLLKHGATAVSPPLKLAELALGAKRKLQELAPAKKKPLTQQQHKNISNKAKIAAAKKKGYVAAKHLRKPKVATATPTKGKPKGTPLTQQQHAQVKRLAQTKDPSLSYGTPSPRRAERATDSPGHRKYAPVSEKERMRTRKRRQPANGQAARTARARRKSVL